MLYDQHGNFPYAKVAIAPSSPTSGTTFSLLNADADLFPDPVVAQYNLVAWAANQNALTTNSEVIRVTTKGAHDSGGVGYTQFTIQRLQEQNVPGTMVARSIQVGDQISNNTTQKWWTDIETNKLDRDGTQVMTGKLSFTGSVNPGLIVNSLTTTQINALTATNGIIAYNSTLTQLETYGNGQWTDISKSPATKVVAINGSGYNADFYATGTNDHTTILNAANAVSTAGGGNLFVRAGTYNFAGNISWPSSVNLMGEGWNTIFKLANATNTDLFTITGKNTIIFRDFLIDGNNTNQTASSIGIKVSATSSKFTFQNIYVKNTSLDGIQIVGSSDFRLDNCYGYNCGKTGVSGQGNGGIDIATSNDFVLVGCKADACQYEGINIFTCHDFSIIAGKGLNSTVEHGLHINLSYDFDITGGDYSGNTIMGVKNIDSHDYTMSNLICNNNLSYGISDGANIGTTYRRKIIGCTANGNVRGIVVADNGLGTLTCIDSQIIGNTTNGNSQGGLVLSQSSNNIVSNNISKNNQYGIVMFNICNNNTFSNNHCYDDQGTKTQLYGISESTTSNSNIYDSNHVEGNINGGIQFQGTNSVDLGNFDNTTVNFKLGRISSDAGNNITIQAGGAQLGGTNLNGGSLNLQAGKSTGSGSGQINLIVNRAGGSGTQDNPATTILSLNQTSGGTLNIGPANATGIAAGSLTKIFAQGASATSDTAGGILSLESGTSRGIGDSKIQFATATAGSSGNTVNNTTVKMVILGNGNVGIGITNPAYLLDVAGIVNINQALSNTLALNITGISGTGANVVNITDSGIGAALKVSQSGSGTQQANAAVFVNTGNTDSTTVHIQRVNTTATVAEGVLKILKDNSNPTNDTGALLYILNQSTGGGTNGSSILIDHQSTTAYALNFVGGKQLITAQINKSGGIGINMVRVTAEAGTQPIINFDEESSLNTSGVVRIINKGTGYSLRITDGTNTILNIASNGAITMNNQKITNLADPVNAQDAVTKNYADALISGLSIKDSVQAATTAALPTNTYSNGSSGVGATLTGVSFGVLVIDGYTVALNDRILVQNETTASHNGIYTVTTLGTSLILYVLTRSTDMNQASEVPGAFTFVENGTVNANGGFVCTTSGSVTMGTTSINFTQFSGAGEITAGTGLSKSGNTLSISTSYLGQSSITTLGTITTGVWNATSIGTTYTDAKIKTVIGTTNRLIITGTSTDPIFDISSSYVGQATITTLGTITTGTWMGITIAVANGGTGQTSFTNGQLLIGNTTGNTLTKATLTAGNSITVTNGVGSITIDTIQDIRTSSSPTFSGLSLTGAETITSTSSTALAVGANGTTRPVLQVDASVSSQNTGLLIQGQAVGSGVYLQTISQGINENIYIDAKGIGVINLNCLVGTGEIKSLTRIRTEIDTIGNTSTDGMVLDNVGPASVGAQQWSPRLRFSGNGWKTNATAGSENVSWIMENQPVQGAADPSTNLVTSYSINSGSYAVHHKSLSSGALDLASGGVFSINGTTVLSNNTLGSGVLNSSLTSVGTIATGVWQGTAISHTYLTGIVQADVGGLTTASSPVFAGLSLGTGALNTVGNIEIDGSTARDITVGANSSGNAGQNLSIIAGNAGSGTDITAGNLILKTGIGTGVGTSQLQVWLNQPASSTGSGVGTLVNTLIMNLTSGGTIGYAVARAAAASSGGLLKFSGQDGGTNSNRGGGELRLQAGQTTGNAVPGQVTAWCSPQNTASNGTQNSAILRTAIGAAKILSNNTGTSIVNCTLASNTVCGGIVRYTVEVFDGTNLQIETGQFIYQAVNKGGVFSGNIITPFVLSGTVNFIQSLTSGTLTNTWTITGANPAVLTLNANSSLTPSTGYPRVSYTIENLTQQAIATQ